MNERVRFSGKQANKNNKKIKIKRFRKVGGVNSELYFS